MPTPSAFTPYSHGPHGGGAPMHSHFGSGAYGGSPYGGRGSGYAPPPTVGASQFMQPQRQLDGGLFDDDHAATNLSLPTIDEVNQWQELTGRLQVDHPKREYDLRAWYESIFSPDPHMGGDGMADPQFDYINLMVNLLDSVDFREFETKCSQLRKHVELVVKEVKHPLPSDKEKLLKWQIEFIRNHQRMIIYYFG